MNTVVLLVEDEGTFWTCLVYWTKYTETIELRVMSLILRVRFHNKFTNLDVSFQSESTVPY